MYDEADTSILFRGWLRVWGAGVEGNHSCVSPESASTGVQPWCCRHRVSLVKHGNVFFRIDGKQSLRRASKNNCILSMFSLLSWMKMKLEIAFAFTVSTNLRKKLHAVTSMELFKLIVRFVFTVTANKIQTVKVYFHKTWNLFIEICL